MKFKQVYHPYWDWEEIDYNMWGSVDNAKKHLKKAVEFTGNHRLYGRFMIKVVMSWPISCENAFTDPHLNKRAWVGHAASALANGCPESITRKAWGLLTDEQRFLANKEADRAIELWEYNYFKDKGLRGRLDEEVLF